VHACCLSILCMLVCLCVLLCVPRFESDQTQIREPDLTVKPQVCMHADFLLYVCPCVSVCAFVRATI